MRTTVAINFFPIFWIINLFSVVFQCVELWNQNPHGSITAFFVFQLIGVVLNPIGGLMGFLVSIFWFINLF